MKNLFCKNNILVQIKSTFFLFLLMAFTFSSFSQDKKQKNWSMNGYVKDLQMIMFTEINQEWITNNIIHNRLNFKWYPTTSLTLKVEMRNRFIYGEMVKDPVMDYAKYVDVENGVFDLSDVLLKENSFLLHSMIDRAFIDYFKNKWQLRVGRQRINWAQTFVWNPNDIFNTYSFFDFDYEEKPGSDAVRIQFYPNYTSHFEVAVKMDNKERITAAAFYSFNKWGYDIQFLGGVLNEEDYVVGAGWSGSLFKGGFRGEMSYFHPKTNFENSSGIVVASAGYDYTFKNSLMLRAEALYNENGKKSGDFNINEFYFMDMNAKNLSLTRLSFFGQASYPLTPLLNASVSGMYSPNDNSIYFGPSITYSLKDNLDFSFIAQTFQSEQKTSLGGKGSFVFLRLKSSF